MSERERSRYRLISGDSHVNEPGDLWTARVPSSTPTARPRIESFEQGDAWVLDGVADPINFGMNACAGLPPEQMTGWKRFDEIRRGGYDPAARLEEMDQDGVDAEVLYPTPRLSQAVFAYTDADFHLALVHAYNDWLAEYVATRPTGSPASRCSRTAAPTARSPRSKRVQDLPGDPRRGDGLLPERHAQRGARGRRGVRLPRRGGHPAVDPRVAHAGAAVGAPFAAARLRALLRRAEPHRRDDLRRRVRPLPGALRS